MSSTTPNLGLNVPAHGSFSNSWDVPVNFNWEALDTTRGGVTAISVTGVVTPSITLTATQIVPPNIEFTGTLSNQIAYFVPPNTGGFWSVYNNTTGAFNLIFGYATVGDYFVIPAGQRTFFIGDGTTMAVANTVNFSQILGQIAAGQVPEGAVTQYQFGLFIQTDQLEGPVPTQLTGVWQNSNLPNAAAGPGVTIQADPGTTPSGSFGAVFYYY